MFPPDESSPGIPLQGLDEVDRHWMRRALEMASEAVTAGEVPVGAIIVKDHTVIAAARNEKETLRDPTAHAEMIAITQAAAAMEDWRLEGTTLYVTLEPCVMCAGAIIQARVPRVVFGATDPKAGAVCSLYEVLNDSRLNHRCDVTGGVMAENCGRILTDFFADKRAAARLRKTLPNGR
ncbi:tRNA adenosine(34) deaminase TadA [Crateriforma conspicua]|uniref:tRNA-specific adenosine deaminase n=1 Tax=Crateriforma conspicua TaxID=2527996 RepID=A0A5C6FX51_9PLAN|nr:tRNA adenosine(34) deaminase TadA [Crateriforma conspicua]TWU65970.1 tRNA-specific adenosine deaminase [Crateriforma conspicua]